MSNLPKSVPTIPAPSVALRCPASAPMRQIWRGWRRERCLAGQAGTDWDAFSLYRLGARA